MTARFRWRQLLALYIAGLAAVFARAALAVDAATPAPYAASPLDAAAPPKGVYCTVNGEPVTEAELDSAIGRGLSGLPAGAQLSGGWLEQERKRIANLFIDLILLRQRAAEAGIGHATADFTGVFNADAARRAEQAGLTLDDFKADMEQTTGIPFEQMRSQTINDPLYQRQILRGQLVRWQHEQRSHVPDEKIREYYEAHRTRLFERPEAVRFSRILFLTVDPHTGRPKPEKDQKTAKARAEALLRKLKDSPKLDFAELAKQHSECVSGPFGGDQGVFYRGESRGGEPDELVETAFALETGEVSPLVVSTLGYNILKVTQRDLPVCVTLEAASDRIENDIVAERMAEIRQSLRPEILRANAVIVLRTD